MSVISHRMIRQPWILDEDFFLVPGEERVAVAAMVVQGGHDVVVQTDKQWAELPGEPPTYYTRCRYETVVTIYRIPLEQPYKPGPVPGSLW